MNRHLLIICILFSACSLQAQEVVCHVQNKIKTHNATLLVYQGGQQKARTTVDSSGYYSAKLLVPGYYDIKVSAEGCDTEIMTGVMVAPGKKTPVSIALAAIRGNAPQTRIVSYEGRNRSIEYPMFSIYDQDIAIQTLAPIHTKTEIPYLPVFFTPKKKNGHLDTLNTTTGQLQLITENNNTIKKKRTPLDWVRRLANRI